MEDRNQKLEKLLDAGLRHYTGAEPRPGLETRVLQTLSKEPKRFKLWPWVSGLPIAAALLIGGALFITRRMPVEQISGVTTPSASNIQIDVQTKILLAQPQPGPRRIARSRTDVHRSMHPAVAHSDPRLEQFPSPQPLNEQEEMLVRYVQAKPQEATMLAQARAAVVKQDSDNFERLHPQPQDQKQ
jgi:hypothetical protein